MHIGIDGNEANVDKQVGVSVYTLNLLQYFQTHADQETQFTIFLKHPPCPFMPEQTEHFRYAVVPGKILWSQVFLPIHLNLKRNIDVFFSPAHYAPRLCPTPLVVTIHDLSYVYYPQEFLKKDLYKLQNWTRYSVMQAAEIITVSKTTKKDVLSYYPVDKKHVHVVYNGFEKRNTKKEDKQPAKELLEQYELKKNQYVYYVGTLQPRKNIILLIQAFAQFHKDNPAFKLVITGKKGWLYEEILSESENLGIQENVCFTDYIPDEGVTTLYQNAFCFVLPSLYEGFGIPVLEAMANGCPVIASFASSLPEIGGEACLYFNPHDAKDLQDKLNLLKSDSTLRSDLIKKGKKRTQDFSWETCGRETLELLRKTIDETTHKNLV